MKRCRIAIAGAGIAGLAAGTFLAKVGHDISIFERFDTPRPVGAGLMIQPTGLACLAALGLDGAAQDLGRRIDGIHGRTASGRLIFDLAYRDIGYPCYAVAMHRAALFGLLADAAKRCSIPIQTSTTITHSVNVDGGRTLVDQSGRSHGPFDLVIDGTGMRSPLRDGEAKVWLDRPYPYGAVWGVAEEPANWSWKHSLRQCYDGCQVMVGILPIGSAPGSSRQLSAVFWSLRTADYPAWRDAGIEPWRTRVTKIWPEVEPFVSQFKSTQDLSPASYADIWLARPDADRLAFIGDAARSASPQLGQGANLALVDALILSRCLNEHTTIGAALHDYARRRRAHTRFYGVASRLLTPFFQSDSRIAAHVRDASFAALGKVPLIRREMVRMLAGVKTGPFSALDPAALYPSHVALPRDVSGSSQPL